MELDDITGALLAFHQMKKNIDENSHGEGVVVKGNYKHGRSCNKGDSFTDEALLLICLHIFMICSYNFVV